MEYEEEDCPLQCVPFHVGDGQTLDKNRMRRMRRSTCVPSDVGDGQTVLMVTAAVHIGP